MLKSSTSSAHAHAAHGGVAQVAHQRGRCWRRRGSRSTAGRASSGRLDQREPAAVGGRVRPAAGSRSRSAPFRPACAAARGRPARCRAGAAIAVETGRSTFCGNCAQAPRISSARSAMDRRKKAGMKKACSLPVRGIRSTLYSAGGAPPASDGGTQQAGSAVPSSSQRSSAASSSSSIWAWRSASSAAREAS